MSRDRFEQLVQKCMRDGWPQDPYDFAEKVLFYVGIIVVEEASDDR